MKLTQALGEIHLGITQEGSIAKIFESAVGSGAKVNFFEKIYYV